MIRKNFLILKTIFIFNFISSIYCSIVHISKISDAQQILNSADKNSLVIFDIDETLIMPVDKLLQGFTKLKYKVELDQLTYSKIIKQAAYKVVEEETKNYIKVLQNKKIKIIGLTLSGVGKYGVIDYLQQWRFDKMKEIGIDLQNSFSINFSFDNLIDKILTYKIPTINEQKAPMFYKGIILCNGMDKGTVLQEFLKRVNWNPKKIIFFDDVLMNLKSVEVICNKLNIKYEGFHYTAAREIEEKEPINVDVINYQLEHLRKTDIWLTDSVAIKYLNKK